VENNIFTFCFFKHLTTIFLVDQLYDEAFDKELFVKISSFS